MSPENFTILDTSLRAVAGSHLLLLGAVTVVRKAWDANAKLTLAVIAESLLYLATYPVFLRGGFSPIFALMVIGPILLPPTLWALAGSFFCENFALRPRHLLFVVIHVVFQLLGILFSPYMPGPLAHEDPAAIGLGVLLFHTAQLLALAWLISALYFVLRDWGPDLVEPRRHLRAVILGAVGIFASVNVIATMIKPLIDAEYVLEIANTSSIVVLAFSINVLVFELRNRLFPARASPVGDTNGPDQAIIQHLESWATNDKGYREAGLTIRKLADQLGVKEYVLRQVINRQLGFRNFNVYLNELRIRDAAEQLTSEEKRHSPVLTIALDVGYRSLGPFNKAFKETYGATPTEYRKRQRNS